MKTARRSIAPVTVFAGLALLLGACVTGLDPEDTGTPGGVYGKADNAFANQPLFLTGGFDGSQRFAMWIETMEYTRWFAREYDKSLHWTYFINTCFYDRTVRGSAIGTAKSRNEEIVRWALTQQVINEGHEVANHAVRHKDGTNWTAAQWRAELTEWQTLVEGNLFKPIQTSATRWVFPNWQPVAGVAAGAVGAVCTADDECDSGSCLRVAAGQSFCTKPCNANKPCPSGTVCGAPDWQETTDVCVPKPQLPVDYQGEVLFDADGRPNLSHPALKPYKPIGFRAPELGHNAAMFDVLTELGYEYDTSQVISIGPPARVKMSGRTFPTIYEFGLMKNTGSATIPMDYNYYVNNKDGARMLADYRQSIVDAYVLRTKQPWNIGHHFSQWRNGEYWTAMKGAFEFAAQGCPDSAGTPRCPEIEFPTFAQLTTKLDDILGHADGEDIFNLPDAPAGGPPPEAADPSESEGL
jgi:peptidoglycan/xylan/chitin deacetylase (PgdA/CDA1 family)